MMRGTAIAHPNIALAKYWGKMDAALNVPAVPSLSVTLAGMTTTTTVTFDASLAQDELVLDDVVQEGRPLTRATALLNVVRAEAGFTTAARVVSKNDFPTASGLASSASGFAALALAAVRAANLDWPAERVSDLARRSSASAARSVFGGFVELDGGEGSTGAARAIAPPGTLDLAVLVCVTNEGQKSVPSTDGMTRSQASPYYEAWLREAPRNFARMKDALTRTSFAEVGELAEASALAMHACAMAAGVVYVSGATLAAFEEVRAMRAAALSTYATIDAGPHLKCLVRRPEAAAAKARLLAVPGVLRVIEAFVGEGAR